MLAFYFYPPGISGVRSSSLCLSALASSCSTLGPLPDQPLDPLQTLSASSLMHAPGNHSDKDRFSLSGPERHGLASDPQVRPARPGVTPPSALSGQMSRCWPVLPPISPLGGEKWFPSPSPYGLFTHPQCLELNSHTPGGSIVPDVAGYPHKEREIHRPESSDVPLLSLSLRSSCFCQLSLFLS